MQDQYKFIYDTLEEFVQCGYTYFPVKEISQALRDKSKKQEGGKRVNQYEKEYVVRPQRHLTKTSSRQIPTPIIFGTLADENTSNVRGAY